MGDAVQPRCIGNERMSEGRKKALGEWEILVYFLGYLFGLRWRTEA